CYGYYLLATGYADIMIDPIMSPWDSLALIPIIKGSGGVITDYHGNDPVTGNSIIVASSEIHSEVISLLNP
ncbi:MAG: histidinol-phosphatase, partial [Ignavibacteriaceae bacterium]|nr:histidinol-phosphatase [Ignavibacteriaceae bacterium]